MKGKNLPVLFLYKDKKRGDLVNVWQWDGVRAHFCAPIHSRVVKNKRINVCGQTIHVRTSCITYGMMKLIASPCSWSWVRCWRQLRNALFIAGTCFTRTVPQLRSAPPSCQPRGKWCTSQKQTYREVIFDLPHHPPPKVRDMTTSNNSPPRAQRAGIVPVVARGVVTSLIELCINDILENQRPLFPGYFKLCSSF